MPRIKRVFHEARRIGEPSDDVQIALAVDAHVCTVASGLNSEGRYHVLLITWEGVRVQHCAGDSPRRHEIRNSRTVPVASPNDGPRIAVLAADTWFSQGADALAALAGASGAPGREKVLS